MIGQGRLPDGRRIRLLPGVCTQAQIFELVKQGPKLGLWDPAVEDIATVKDLRMSIDAGYRISGGRSYVASNLVGFYLRDETGPSLRLGKKLMWVETLQEPVEGHEFDLVMAVLDLSGIAGERIMRADGRRIFIEQADGIGTIPISKLEKKTTTRGRVTAHEVTLKSDFNPETDLKVKNIAVNCWSDRADEDGFPLKAGGLKNEVAGEVESARGTRLFDDGGLSTSILPREAYLLLAELGVDLNEIGWFGSVSFNFDNLMGSTFEEPTLSGLYHDVWTLCADRYWYEESRIIVVSRQVEDRPWLEPGSSFGCSEGESKQPFDINRFARFPLIRVEETRVSSPSVRALRNGLPWGYEAEILTAALMGMSNEDRAVGLRMLANRYNHSVEAVAAALSIALEVEGKIEIDGGASSPSSGNEPKDLYERFKKLDLD